MKTLIHTLTNTYKTIRLLSNPAVSELLERELNLKTAQSEADKAALNLGTKNTFFHKHYVVQVTN